MEQQLTKALIESMKFRDINPESITTVESTVGFIWFKAGKHTYYVSISKASFDLEKYDRSVT